MQDARSLAEAINLSEANRLIEAHRFVEEQKIKRALGPKEWERLKAHIQAECEKIAQSSSTRLHCSLVGVNELTISNPDNGRRVILSYDENVPCVFYDTPVVSGRHLAFRVSPDGTSVQFMRDGAAVLIGTIAFDLIRDIIGS